MTVETTTNKLSYDGNDSTVAFATPRFDANADIVATLEDASGDETILTITTDYTLAGAGNPSGGTLTMLTAPATGETLTIKTDPPQTQTVDYVENDAFPAESHEGALDKLTLIVQSLSERIGRAITFKVSSQTTDVTVPEPDAGKLLAWDSSGEDLENKDAADFSAATLPLSIANGGTGEDNGDDALVGLGGGTTGIEVFKGSNAGAIQSTLSLVPGTDVEEYDPDILKRDQSQTLTVGMTEAATSYTSNASLLVSNGGMRTVDVTSNGSCNIALLSGVGSIRLNVRNDGSGAVTYDAGYDYIFGSYDATKGMCKIEVVNDGTDQTIQFNNSES